jgi:hypothetical protein
MNRKWAVPLILLGVPTVAAVLYLLTRPIPTHAVLVDYSSGKPVPVQRSAFTDPSRTFTLDLPANCKVSSRPNLPDFAVYDVICHGREYVGIYAGIYVGFAPQTIPRSRVIKAGGGVIQVWANTVPGDQKRADWIVRSVRLVRAQP